MIDNLLYAKLPPHLKRSIKRAYLESGFIGYVVTQLERELELSGLETDGELPIPTMTTTTTTLNRKTQPQNPDYQKIRQCCEKPRHVIKRSRNRIRKEQEQQGEKNLLQDQMQNIASLAALPKN